MPDYLIAITVICSILGLVLLTSIFVGVYFIRFALYRYTKPFDDDGPKIIRNEEFVNSKHEVIKIKSFDNLTLSGHLYKNDSNIYVIMCHGYKGRWYEHSYLASLLYKEGYNILLFDHRASGESEGKRLSMGYYERIDLQNWIKEIKKINSNAKFVCYGWSMGGATVLSSDYSKDDNILCLISDASYTSTREQFYAVMQKSMKHFPHKFIMFNARIFAKMLLGISFVKNSPIENINNIKSPVLLIHGGADDFVPTSMCEKLIENSKNENISSKIFEGSWHVMSLTNYPNEYFKLVNDFIKSNS